MKRDLKQAIEFRYQQRRDLPSLTLALEKIMSHVNPIQIQKYLKGIDYPVTKAALIENAKKMGADENVCASLEQLPDQKFGAPVDVSQALGQLH